MLTSNLDAIFRATDALRGSAPVVIRAIRPDSPMFQSLERLYQAAEAFQASFARTGGAGGPDDGPTDAPA